jgi:hypothetical protein
MFNIVVVDNDLWRDGNDDIAKEVCKVVVVKVVKPCSDMSEEDKSSSSSSSSSGRVAIVRILFSFL